MAREPRFSVVNVHWHDALRGILEVTCDSAGEPHGIDHGTLVFRDTSGRRVAFGVHQDASPDAVMVHAHMTRSLDGRALPDGVWSITLELASGTESMTLDVPAPTRPLRVSWWRRGLRVVAHATPDGQLQVAGFGTRMRAAADRRFGPTRRTP